MIYLDILTPYIQMPEKSVSMDTISCKKVRRKMTNSKNQI